jgi:hypothetical protein
LFLPEQPARLGGSWLSLATVHIGGFFLWSGIFATNYQGTLHGIAYLFWTISMLPIVWELWRVARQGLASLTDRSLSLESGAATAD